MKALLNMKANEEGMNIYKMHSNKPVALVTMQGVNIVKKILDRLQLSFNFIITRENEIDRVQQIRKAIDEMNLRPRNVLVVGDRDRDEIAAKQIGCEFVKVKK